MIGHPNFIAPFQTRLIPSGVLTLAAGAYDTYLGENARQKRWQFVCSNLSSTAGSILYLRTGNGLALLPVNPGESKTIDTVDTVQVYNAAAISINYIVCERFLDEGYSFSGNTVAQVNTRGVAAAASGTAGATGGSSGGYTGGGSSGGGGGGGTQPQ
jgi:uncharacterized membrane protein YgcG